MTYKYDSIEIGRAGSGAASPGTLSHTAISFSTLSALLSLSVPTTSCCKHQTTVARARSGAASPGTLSHITISISTLSALLSLSVPTSYRCKQQTTVARAGSGAASPGTIYFYPLCSEPASDEWVTRRVQFFSEAGGREYESFHPSIHTRKAHIRICTDCREALSTIWMENPMPGNFKWPHSAQNASNVSQN